ncbi:MAG: hypothetical protein Q9198_008311, partial [Flavoplaca austrocitrina]
MNDWQSTLSSDLEAVQLKPLDSGPHTDRLHASPSTEPTGVGLGPIDPRFLARETWPLHSQERIFQYHKFTQLMIHRIRSGESNDQETKMFIDLIDYPNNEQYLVPASGMLSELVEPGPLKINEQMTMLVGHVKTILHAKEEEHVRHAALNPRDQPEPMQTADDATADARDKLARLLFGSKGESNATPAMKRLLTSWLSMGYPGKALEHLMEQDSKRGRGKTRDSLGFPYRSRSRYPSRRVQKEDSPDAQKPKLNTPQGNQPLDHSSSIEDSGCARKFPLHPKKPTPNTPQKLHSPSSDSAATLIETAGSTKKNGHGTYTPGDSDSPPTSDDPPEDLLWELTDLDRDSSGDSKATDTEEPRVSFWDF